MPGSFTSVDLSQLPAPSIIEVIDFEQIVADMLADLRARWPEFDALVESDPGYILLEVAAYREMLLRQRLNEAAKALMLAFAAGADLDQLGANVNVARLVVTPADATAIPPVAAVYESDNDFRARIQLSFEGYTTAGSSASYKFHGVSADGAVQDVSPVSPTPGVVDVYVLSRTGDGTASADLIAKVTAALSAELVRPMTDNVTVQSAAIIPYSVQAVLTMYPGPDASVVLSAAQVAAQQYVDDMRRIGYDITRSGIYRALHQPGVQNVQLIEPAADIAIDDTQAAHCTTLDITTAPLTHV